MVAPKPERIKERLKRKVKNTLPIPKIYLVNYSIIHRFNPIDEIKRQETITVPGFVSDISEDYDYCRYCSETDETIFVKSNYRMPHFLVAGHPIF